MADLLSAGESLAVGGGLPMIDLNPITWLGDAVSAGASTIWKAAMIGVWSAGLWLLSLAFKIIDALTTPDLSAQGPMGAVLPTTLWIGATVAGTMMFVQLTVAVLRRDGRSLGRVLLGVGQFGLVWVGYLGVAGGLVTATAGLARGIVQSMLNVDSLSAFDPSSSWPREVVDATVATVLGLSSLLLLIPAAFFYLVIMFVREAALIILVATAPISAGGLVNDSTRSWFWKSLRWFISCLLISPTTALVLGIGVRVSAGVVAGRGDSTAQAAGMAVVGAVLIAVGAICPLVLFRLLAFVEPGTASGAALRQSWSDAGGLPGLLSGGQRNAGAGTGAAALMAGDGRSHGEAAAEAQSAGRLAAFAGAAGAVGSAVGAGVAVATRSAGLAGDVLGGAGVGHPGQGMPPGGDGGRRVSGSGRSRADSPPHGDHAGGHGGAMGGGAADGSGPSPAVPVPAPISNQGLTAWAGVPAPPSTTPSEPPVSTGGLVTWAHDDAVTGQAAADGAGGTVSP